MHTIHDLPSSERPRERMSRLGPAALSDRELLAILLRTGNQGCGAIDLAAKVLEHFDNSLTALSEANPEELCNINGIGHAKAATLGAAFEMARRAVAAEAARTQLNTPAQIADFMRTRFLSQTQEEFHVLMLDVRHGVIREERVTLGLLDRSLVHAREVFRSAIRCSCHQVVVCHNHPSGDPRPSPEDCNLTINLMAAGKILDIELLDHIILGQRETDPAGRGFYSFASSRPEFWRVRQHPK